MFQTILDKVRTEPVAVANAVAAVLSAIIIAVVAFGIDVTDGQRTALVGIVIALGALGATLFARPRVTPTD